MTDDDIKAEADLKAALDDLRPQMTPSDQLLGQLRRGLADQSASPHGSANRWGGARPGARRFHWGRPRSGRTGRTG
ncbi:MAG: hypothetical protein LBL55_02420, partial [Propionibacteriaceae bacterium]|nr:hypothetical protein [Propionibacteriaceae bacterium]